MEDSRSKIEACIKPIIKVGIPLVISVGCLLWAKFSTRSVMIDYPKEEEEDDDGEGFRSMNHLLMEFGNLLKMEMVRIEILNTRISSMEVENQKLGNMVMEYLKVLEEMELRKLESEVVKRKVKRLFRIVNLQSRSIRRNQRKLEAQEMEVSVERREREEERNVVKKLKDEVRELRRLSSAETSKITEEASAMEEYSNMLKELQQLQKDQASEEQELDACLRHKLLIGSDPASIEEDEEQITSANLNSLQLAVAEETVVVSKRKKMLQKLRKWVEGSDHHKGKHRENEHNIDHARRSCSSA